MPANEESLQTLYVEIKARLDKLDAGLRTAEQKSKTAADKMNATFASVGSSLGAAFSVTAIIGFAKKSVEAYAQQEKANKKLETALGRTSKALLDYANAIQFQSTFADEQIIEANARFAMFTKDEKMIKELTKATMDFAVAQGMDLVSASNMVVRTFMGEQDSLGRLKINIHGAAGSTERFNSLTREMNRLWSGHDLAQASTETGKLANQLKRLDEIAEDLGGKLLPLIIDLGDKLSNMSKERPVVDIVMGDDLKALEKLARWISGHRDAFKVSSTLGKTTEDLKKDRTSVEKAMNKSTAEAREKTKEELDAEKKALEERKQLQEQFYDAVKFVSEKYYGWKTNQIEKEKIAYIKATGDKVAAEKWANDQLFQLNEERAQLQNAINLKNNNLQAKGLDIIPHQMIPIDNATIEKLKEIYEKILKDAGDWNSELKKSRDTMNNISDIGYALEDAFSKSGDTLLAKLNQALQIALNISRAINAEDSGVLGTIASIIPGLGFIGSLFGLHKGGTVVNSGGRVSVGTGFATGTDFIVPKGFPGDSYPCRVESGERVTVTPANRVAESMGGFKSDVGMMIVNAIKAMNMNLVRKDFSVVVKNTAPDVKTTVIKHKRTENVLVREGKTFDEF